MTGFKSAPAKADDRTAALYNDAREAGRQAGLAIRAAGWFGDIKKGSAWLTIGRTSSISNAIINHARFLDHATDYENGRLTLYPEFGLDFSDNLADQIAQCHAFASILTPHGVDCTVHSLAA